MSIGVPAGSLGDLSDHCDDLRGVDNVWKQRNGEDQGLDLISKQIGFHCQV